MAKELIHKAFECVGNKSSAQPLSVEMIDGLYAMATNDVV